MPSSAKAVRLEWRPREVPLPPCAAVARADASLRLARRLLVEERESLSRMVGLFGSRCVFVEAPHPAGSAFRLPWVDGIEYLGRDPAAPELLLPTALEPNVSVSLLPAALRGYGVEPPAAVCGGNAPAVFHTGSARRLTFEQLQAWIERQ